MTHNSERRHRRLRWQMALTLLAVGSLVPVPWDASASGQVPSPAATEPGGVAYRVNYRASASDPWQIYAQTKSLDKANAIANEVKQSGYLVEVVDSATPSPQPYPDMADYSASNYYPTSNWTQDYNYYNVPSGGLYNYGWYGGWYPGYWHRSYPWYAWNGGNYWHSGYWRGHGWYGGWRRGWGEGWNTAGRHWNRNHASRGSHFTHAERNHRNAHHANAVHRNTAGRRGAGHRAAGHHAANHAGEHRGTGHRQGGGRNGGGRGGAHRASGHGRTGGGHAAGHHSGHLDP